MKITFTDAAIKRIKPRKATKGKNAGKLVDTKYADGSGLYLLVKVSGSKVWRYDIDKTIGGKRIRKTLTYGQYPAISLKEARQLHQDALNDLALGKIPTTKKAEKAIFTFSQLVEETHQRLELRAATLEKRKLRLEKYIIPRLDPIPLEQITAIDILNILKPIAEAGNRETAVRLAGYCRQIFDTALAMQLIPINPAESIARLLPKPKPVTNFSHLTDQQDLKALLLAIDNYTGSHAVKSALQFMPHVFLRPKNIRFLRWEYVDFTERLITFPAEQMKTNRPHKVPLSHQAFAILEQMQAITGGGEFVFHTGNDTPLSDATLTKALGRLRHPETGQALPKMTAHGFRHTASTLLNEMGHDAELIEMQLSHKDPNEIRDTYNKAERLPQRAKMMQAWSDYLDGLKADSNVIPFKTANG